MFTSTFFLAATAVAVVSYLLGSLNFGIIVSRVLMHGDVREHGSGGAGMTNMLRTYGKGPAAITAVGDFAKAVVSILFARFLFAKFGISFVDAGYIAGLFVILGHVYPLYFGFRGGKGVMTTLGVILFVNPPVFFIIVLIFVPILFAVKIVSLISISGAVAYPILTYFVANLRHQPAFVNTMFACVYAAVIIYMHRGNIKRLLNGTEHKFGTQKKQ